jgi:NAD(P)-dependent dehydrogenase (short-subunit alcohol dehydrogenase family)
MALVFLVIWRVNNAGLAGPTAGIKDITYQDWAQTLDVNVTSQFLFTRGVVPHLKAQRSGCIVNMSSASGRLGMPMCTPYAAAKWAVIELTQSLAMELDPLTQCDHRAALTSTALTATGMQPVRER